MKLGTDITYVYVVQKGYSVYYAWTSESEAREVRYQLGGVLTRWYGTKHDMWNPHDGAWDVQ